MSTMVGQPYYTCVYSFKEFRKNTKSSRKRERERQNVSYSLKHKAMYPT